MMKKSPDFIIYILTILYFLCDGTSGYAQEDASYCSTYTFEMIPGDSVRLIPGEYGSTFTGQISKKVDLNFDGLDDFIINFGICGNWGDCVYGIYAQQADQKYTCVFRPEYWYSGKWDLLEKEYTRVDGVSWMKLRLYSRTDYGGGPPGIVPTYLLQFDGSSYQTIELQSLTNWPNNANETETFGVQKEYTHRGKTYQVGRLLLKGFKYGPLTLRVIEKDTVTDILAPTDEYPDLEMSRADLIQLHGRPLFFVIDRYRIYLVDLENEKISARIQPGLGVAYGDDSISGTVNGFQFFDDYLLGAAVNYGVFCFDISDLDDPKELLRYSSDFSDQGQPYFFLEQNADGSYNGLVSRSDTTKKSMHISGFYADTKQATYLFRDAHLTVPEVAYADPADYEIGHPEPFLLLYEKGKNGKKTPWVVDLKKGILIKNEAAKHFLDKQP